jgi:hypothetical protein
MQPGGYDDPGWPSIPALIGVSMTPWRRSRTLARDGLTATRTIWIGLVGSVVLYLPLLAFIAPWRCGRSVGIAPVLLIGAVFPTLAAVAWTQRRSLDASSPGALAGTWRTSFFFGIGFAQSIGLAAFTVAVLTGNARVYVLGMLPTLIGLAMIAPSRRNIDRRQQEIGASGSPLSLGRALMGPSPPDQGKAGLE